MSYAKGPLRIIHMIHFGQTHPGRKGWRTFCYISRKTNVVHEIEKVTCPICLENCEGWKKLYLRDLGAKVEGTDNVAKRQEESDRRRIERMKQSPWFRLQRAEIEIKNLKDRNAEMLELLKALVDADSHAPYGNRLAAFERVEELAEQFLAKVEDTE
jgi:hypothetical protein